MTLTAALLLIVSALTHAGWNLFSKRDDPSLASFLLANIFGTLLVVPLLVYGRSEVAAIVAVFWPLLLLTGFFQAMYFTGLAFAYRTGELSVTYPLARSLPSLIVPALFFVVGRGGEISNLALSGMALIVVGGFLIPLASFNDFSFRRYRSGAVVMALVAAAGTAGYSLVDDYVLELISPRGGKLFAGAAFTALYYIGLQGATTIFWQGVTVVFNRQERANFSHKLKHPLSSAMKGAVIFLTYTLVLISMGYVTNVSYVVAFRQLSIPIGLVFGLALLKERAGGPKLVAVLLLFSGVVLVGIG